MDKLVDYKSCSDFGRFKEYDPDAVTPQFELYQDDTEGTNAHHIPDIDMSLLNNMTTTLAQRSTHSMVARYKPGESSTARGTQRAICTAQRTLTPPYLIRECT